MYQYFATKKYGEKFILKDNDFHHIKNVIRLKENEKVTIVYMNDKYICKILNFDQNQCNLKILEVLNITKSNKPIVNLFCGIIREQKWDYLLQKTTELGVNNIYPVIFKRSIIKIEPKDEVKKITRWQNIVLTASKQTKSTNIPTVMPIIRNLDDVICKNADLNIICYENEKNTTLKSLISNKKDSFNSINILIGPEGGFENYEVKLLEEANYNIVTLGSNILRAETAPLFVLSCLNYEFET
ncbi:16S rRNA (uracil1498-N3)-methyltransferase [Spiroplasma litorale]|uniref:Ribosomal RNA small subunit methyltransferase E n=1 Tax=Spiroplasma litorale TaxID=216942 RepID=A0A0K1W1D7_9MOLU|nr:RsmE family RNA methyltransferase [Spiroplasma litorale]AKX33996.1 16S rRNA (uracil1498-N3)-methyltransferase [Spiroplasma litorale]